MVKRVYVPNQNAFGTAAPLELIMPGSGGLNDRFLAISRQEFDLGDDRGRACCVYSVFAKNKEAYDAMNIRVFLKHMGEAVQRRFADSLEGMKRFDEREFRRCFPEDVKRLIEDLCSSELGKGEYIDRINIIYVGEFLPAL